VSIVTGIFTSRKHPDERSDAVGFDVLFNEYYDRLVYFAYQFVKDKEQAQDIVQEAFIKYWDQKETVMANKIAVKNFLYSTVRNASLNCIRHAKVVEGYIQLHCTAEPEERPIIDAIINAEIIAELHAAIQALPHNYRSVSVLGYLEGKKNQEIADELEMSVNTVKKQKQKALQLLRGQLVPEMFVLFMVLASCFFI
jgi:RNA polymerase sigma-70 factor (family 1)